MIVIGGQVYVFHARFLSYHGIFDIYDCNAYNKGVQLCTFRPTCFQVRLMVSDLVVTESFLLLVASD